MLKAIQFTRSYLFPCPHEIPGVVNTVPDQSKLVEAMMTWPTTWERATAAKTMYFIHKKQPWGLRWGLAWLGPTKNTYNNNNNNVVKEASTNLANGISPASGVTSRHVSSAKLSEKVLSNRSPEKPCVTKRWVGFDMDMPPEQQTTHRTCRLAPC